MYNKPVKLVRNKKAQRLLDEKKLKSIELEFAEDKKELNKLFKLKIQEELNEIEDADVYKKAGEFADLIQVLFDYANFVFNINGETINDELFFKHKNDGQFDGTILVNLNPNNPSNKIYFQNQPNNNNDNS